MQSSSFGEAEAAAAPRVSGIRLTMHQENPEMITRLNVASIYVLDKDEALDFYVNKLGLEKGNDVRQGTTAG